ncbi:endonuclease/exonuclease/phosphatase family protein [Vibrio sp. 10N]|uniref:endonuclease/exonuclease/phosphatase family protein n=1 Tax=Vibrio sp. 10N TaxID=3058938 RepID=UPI0028148560|nr:endonuclease/exonuclease/phosphatase family protein [Vibrio sp. 10N]
MAITMIRTNGYKYFVTTLLVGIALFPTLSIAQGQSLTLMTWNLEWLTTTPSAKFKASYRSEDDFHALNLHFKSVNPDILAFQEVDSVQAIKRVVGKGYRIYLSERSAAHNRQHQFSDINQYTGFAIKETIKVTDSPDFPLLQTNKLRFASAVTLEFASNQQVHLLSVHLKAGCSGKLTRHSACKQLKQQGQVINSWLQQRDVNNESYLILGDFNHNLSYREDWLWTLMTQGLTTTPRLASESTKARCKVRSKRNPNSTHQYRSLIDHIVVSPSLRSSPAKQNVMPTSKVIKYQMSDHCPLSITLYGSDH